MQIHPTPWQNEEEKKNLQKETKQNDWMKEPKKWTKKKKQKNYMYKIENGGKIIKAMQDVPQKITK